MEDEKLMECVRKYEFLYNLQHPKHMDNVRKEKAWREISEKMKQPAAACKQRWQGLRDAYRRALNKRKGKTGRAAKNFKKWKYEEEMSFVASYFVEKKNFESVELTNDDEASQSNEMMQPETLNPNSDNAINIDALDVASINTTDTEIQNDSDTIARNKSSQPQHSQEKKTKKKVQPLQSASAVLMSRLLDTQNIISQQREHDELDRFFLNISETVKKFSPYIQAVAKNKIFGLVSEMELEQLAPPLITSTPQYHTPSPASATSSTQSSATPLPASETKAWFLQTQFLNTQ